MGAHCITNTSKKVKKSNNHPEVPLATSGKLHTQLYTQVPWHLLGILYCSKISSPQRN